MKWAVFCTATGRRPRLDPETRRFFDIGDRTDLSYADKLTAYRRLADDYFETERYFEFCARHLVDVDEAMVDFVRSAEFDALLVATVTSTFPAQEHEHFVAHFRGLLAAWADDQSKVVT